MQILLREIVPGSAGQAAGYRDREIQATRITLGSAADCTIQIVGADVLRRHATLKQSGAGFDLRCERGANVQVDGATKRSARLEPGAEVLLAGARLRIAPAPPGFAAAIEFTPAGDVDPRTFEAAYVTELRQTRLSKRGPAWALGLGLLAIGLLVPWLLPADWLPWWTSDTVWSSGPLLPAHAVAIGDDCSACHVVPFQHVQDQACTACHSAVADHAPAPQNRQVGLDTVRCASCHKEHNTPAHIIDTANTLCTDCHARPDWPDSRLAAAAGFTEATHPAFKVDLLTSTHQPGGNGSDYRWSWQSSPLAEARNTSNLKYPHDLHLDPRKVQDLVTGKALGCSACHTLQADREHFEPISMERHCRACHDLKFDHLAPDRQLPHANPSEALMLMQEHYMRMYADPDARPPTRSRRRLPDHPHAMDTCEGPAYLCARARTAREAENQFNVRGCVTCHEVTVIDTDNLLERYQVAPVRLTPDFYRAARFDHRAHLTQRDASGDAACLTCHAADRSTTSADVLMPDIGQCTTCHGDGPQGNGPQGNGQQADLLPLDCVACHSFHPKVAKEGAE